MHYIDTSVLVAYLVEETYSELADNVCTDENRQPLAISAWTETEFFSALGIKCRTEQITETQWFETQEQYLLLKPSLVFVPVLEKDYLTATNFVKHWQTKLRAGDALHLAIAANNDARLLSLDKRLAEAASYFNIPAEWLRAGE